LESGNALPGRDLPAVIWQLGRLLFGSWLPDLTLVLDLPAETSLARTHRPLDRIESRGPAYLNRVRQAFLSEAQAQPDAIRVIDATQSPVQVAAQIASIVDGLTGEWPTADAAALAPMPPTWDNRDAQKESQ
jgi:thymidylate kinase